MNNSPDARTTEKVHIFKKNIFLKKWLTSSKVQYSPKTMQVQEVGASQEQASHRKRQKYCTFEVYPQEL